MNCDRSLKVLYQFIDRDLAGEVTGEITFHLKECHSCWDRFEFEKKLRAHVQRSCKCESPSEELLARIKALLDKF